MKSTHVAVLGAPAPANPEEPLERLLTYAELSRETGIAKGTLYAMVSGGRIPYVRIGKRSVRFSRNAINEWLAVNAVSSEEVAK
jgi:excisionase family DNA binding protein